MTADTADRPLLRLNPGQGRRLRAGNPWAFSNELAMRPEYRQWPPGRIVRIESAEGWRHGAFIYNPHSLIAARRLDRNPDAVIDGAWLRHRLSDAIALRARVCDTPYHRLVHAEADFLPGLVIDRYGGVAVLQANAAGMDRLAPAIVRELAGLLEIRAVVARNDSPARRQEGLAETVALLHGTEADARAEVEEGGVRFPVSPLSGQKTGWFFDQRPNRDRVATLASGARVLDVFCHVGAFGLRCAAAGAAEVMLVDSSAPALAQAEAAAARNGFGERVRTRRGDAFDVLAALHGEGARFDIVVADPPAFAKSRKDAEAGLRAYARVAKMAAQLVAPGGFLFVASCSHHAPLEQWAARIASGLLKAGRDGRLLMTSGAGPDHPVHPHLPESAYLKAQLFQLT